MEAREEGGERESAGDALAAADDREPHDPGLAEAPPAPATLSARALFKKARRQRLVQHLREAGGLQAVVTPVTASPHPFVCDARDHAETPFEAFRDVEPLLFRLALALGKTKATLRILDPFYCEGSVKTHLGRLGFPLVRNENEDFWAALAASSVPPFDVLVTNPPFSGDHMQRTLAFAHASGKPFLLLMPQFVAKKPFYYEWLKAAAAKATLFVPPVFLGPSHKAYLFAAPLHDASGERKLVEDRTFECEGPTTAAAAVGASAPAPTSLSSAPVPKAYRQGFQIFAGKFQCVWFVSLGAHQDTLLAFWRKKYEAIAHCRMAADPEALPQLMAAQKLSPALRRLRKKVAASSTEGV